MNAAIVRLETSVQGAIGVWLFDGVIFCNTLQPDFADPKKFHLPPGLFVCTRYHGTKIPNTFIITRPGQDNVDGHKFLEVHPGNLEEDTDGCTVVGSSVDKLKGNRAVLNSGATFTRFLDYTKAVDTFPLIIIDLFTG